jgi:hypothetical protein
MGTFLSTAVSVMLVYGGTAGVELIMARYATPEARSVERMEMPASRGQCSTSDPCGDGAARR